MSVHVSHMTCEHNASAAYASAKIGTVSASVGYHHDTGFASDDDHPSSCFPGSVIMNMMHSQLFVFSNVRVER